jgi:hypothetical protein
MTSDLNMYSKAKTIYFVLLLLPVMSAILALTGHGFLFKIGVAGLSSLILLSCIRYNIPGKTNILIVIMAFVFSMGGDYFLSFKGNNTDFFIWGIAMYFVAHLFYLGYAVLNGRFHIKTLIIVLIPYIFYFITLLWQAIESPWLRAAAFMYLLVSVFSLAASAGLRVQQESRWLYISGIICILISDTIISVYEFLQIKDVSFLILPLYYIAQILISMSLISRIKK